MYSFYWGQLLTLTQNSMFTQHLKSVFCIHLVKTGLVSMLLCLKLKYFNVELTYPVNAK